MTLLEEFVFALSKDERAKLRPLRFRGTKREIIFRILKCRTRSGISAADIKRRHHLADIRYHQLLSEMLRTVYEEVVPEGGLRLLEFLGRKELFRHFLREMRRQEAIALDAGDRTALAEYYLQVLILADMLMVPTNQFKDVGTELRQYARRYIETKEPHPDDHHFLRIAELTEKLEDELGKTIRRDRIDRYVAELASIFEQVKDGENFLAIFCSNFTLMLLYTKVYSDRERAKRHIEYGKQMTVRFAATFGANRALFELICDLHDVTSRERQVERLKSYLLSPGHGQAAYSTRYIEKYLPLVIYSGGLQWAKGYIERHFPQNPEVLKPAAASHYASILVVYHIFAEQYDEGQKALRTAFAANMGGNRNIYTEIQLRCHDVFFHVVRGDLVRAEECATRQIRYVRRYVERLEHSYLLRFLTDVRELIRLVDSDRVRAQDVRENFKRQYQGKEQFVHMFEKVYAMHFTNQDRRPSATRLAEGATVGHGNT